MWIDLVLLGSVLLAALSILWSTLRTGMSPMPSSRAARAAMLVALEGTDGPVVELGSGWGHLVFAVARRYPERSVVGYELSWLPWLTSVVLKYCFRLNNVVIHRRNFLAAIAAGELANVNVILCYLHGPGMIELRQRLAPHLLPPKGRLTWLISNNFALPGYDPEARWQLNDLYRSPIYRYYLG